jgi:DNA-binding transcriptional LysR family regulator
MARLRLAELTAFVAVADHRSFTKAATQLGISPPTMSQTIRALEERLGVRLFNRTTRSVALTAAGDRLLVEVQPILEELDGALESVNAFRDKPVGTLRLAAMRPFGAMLLAPLIQPFLLEYPGIRLEIAFDDTRSDIVSGRFDAGVRVLHRVERDMAIQRIGDEFRMLAVAAPAYMAGRPHPVVPQDLYAHNCIQYRLPWDGSMAPWIFTRGEEHIELPVDGSLIINDVEMWLSATLDGVGVGYLPESVIASHLADGRLIVLLEDWSRTLPGIFLYHPSSRHTPMPLRVFLRFVEKWRKQSA